MANPIKWAIARIRGVRREEWDGSAGEQFRQTMDKIGTYVESKGANPDNLVDLGITKLKGVAQKEGAEVSKALAEAAKAWEETEHINIKNEELAKHSEIALKRAEVDLDTAELSNEKMRLEMEGISLDNANKRIEILTREAELMKTLTENGLALKSNGDGTYLVFRPTEAIDYTSALDTHIEATALESTASDATETID